MVWIPFEWQTKREFFFFVLFVSFVRFCSVYQHRFSFLCWLLPPFGVILFRRFNGFFSTFSFLVVIKGNIINNLDFFSPLWMAGAFLFYCLFYFFLHFFHVPKYPETSVATFFRMRNKEITKPEETIAIAILYMEFDSK